jgi:hypothetical protein
MQAHFSQKKAQKEKAGRFERPAFELQEVVKS